MQRNRCVPACGHLRSEGRYPTEPRQVQPGRLFPGRLLAAAALACMALAATPIFASSLQIQFTGLDLIYDGTNIFDAKAANTVRAGNPAQASSLSSMSFYVDNVLVGSVLTSDIFADIYISGITNVLAGTPNIVTSSGNGGAFGIDLLTSNTVGGWGLALDIDTMQFFYTGSGIALTVAGVATAIDTQMLPFGLEFTNSMPVTISITSSSLSHVTTSGIYLSGLRASSAGTIAGVLVPEPSSLALLAIGIVAAGVHALRRRRR